MAGLTREKLRQLTSEAGRVHTAGDTAAAGALLAVLTGADDSDFASFDLDDLKTVMQVAALLGPFCDLHSTGRVFFRCLEAMQALDDAPAAAEYILPLFNLRAICLGLGAREEAKHLLGQIVDAASHADVVTDQTIGVLEELLRAFVDEGQMEAAALLYRPICKTLLASAEADWHVKLEAAARLGRLQLAVEKPEEAVRTYQHALAVLGRAEARPNGDVGTAPSSGDVGKAPMMLWQLMGEAKARAGDLAGVEHAYAMARSLAEAGGHRESREAAVIYHNLAGFWLDTKQRDRYAEGVALTQHALAIAERCGNRQTSDYAGGLGQIASLKSGLGEIDEAQQYYDACFETFAAAADTDTSIVAAYYENEGVFRLQADQARRAAESFAAARALRDEIAGFPRDELADNQAWIGVALFEDGDFAAASRAFRRALALRLDAPAGAAAGSAVPA